MSFMWLESIATACKLIVTSPQFDNGVDAIVQPDDITFPNWRIPVQLKTIAAPGPNYVLANGDCSYPLKNHVYEKHRDGTNDAVSVSGILIVVMLSPTSWQWIQRGNGFSSVLVERSWWRDLGHFRTHGEPNLRADNKRTIRLSAKHQFGPDTLIRKALAIDAGTGTIQL